MNELLSSSLCPMQLSRASVLSTTYMPCLCLPVPLLFIFMESRLEPFPCFDYLDSFDDLDSFEEHWSGALWDISHWDLSGVFLMITLG